MLKAKVYSADFGKVVNAAEIRKPEHPLHYTFLVWCQQQNKEASKRAAREFLQKYPQYRE